jgi:LysR family transcriptional regulator, nitrogen assimilation regulatory protein
MFVADDDCYDAYGLGGRSVLDTRRLQSFVKIVDIGSLTRASDILHVAQPALSQQIIALESQFGKKLLIRSKQGVVPTEAGRALYRHAQIILRQLDQAQTDIRSSGNVVAGRVSVGLAPFSTASVLALPLLQTVRARYPNILLHINENFGGIISEMIMTGKLDVAFIYDPGPIRGVTFEPLLNENLFLVAPASRVGFLNGKEEITVQQLADLELMLPTNIHTVRKVVDTTFRRVGLVPKLIAEIESLSTMAKAISAGMGSTILPWSAANAIRDSDEDVAVLRITKPLMNVKISLCVSDQFPLSEPALAVNDILTELARLFAASDDAQGVQRA